MAQAVQAVLGDIHGLVVHIPAELTDKLAAHIARLDGNERTRLVVPVSVGTWPAPDEPDPWVQSLTQAGWPVQLSSVVVHMALKEFLQYYLNSSTTPR